MQNEASRVHFGDVLADLCFVAPLAYLLQDSPCPIAASTEPPAALTLRAVREIGEIERVRPEFQGGVRIRSRIFSVFQPPFVQRKPVVAGVGSRF